jgi:hypothetical protein
MRPLNAATAFALRQRSSGTSTVIFIGLPAITARKKAPECRRHQCADGTFFVNLLRLYSRRWRKPDMAINGRRNKPFGPGGSTRRLHQFRGSGNRSRGSRQIKQRSHSVLRLPSFVVRSRGRNRIDEGVKGVLLLGMVPPLSGRIHSCQRQLCSGCSGCVSSSKDRPKALMG